MIEMTLTEYAEKVTKKVAASTIHMTPKAIRKAIHSERKIIIRVDDTGAFLAAYEVKDFGGDLRSPENHLSD
jgi:hypothetical protein